jgi:hypothetical protein
MSNQGDGRPGLAVGHVVMRAAGVRAAAERLERVGVRPIVVKDDFAVMELRGGTHIVVRELEGDGVEKLSFDFMVDDIEEGRQRFDDAGFTVTDISRGRIHDSFVAKAPERFRVEVNSSHAGDRTV